MHLESPDTWRIVWLVAAGGFVVVEMLRRLRLWFLPFAVGAAVAAASAWAGLAVTLEWLVFLMVSALTFVALRPIGRRLAWQAPMAKFGSGRWSGREATVEVAIPAAGGTGWVRLGRERWRAESGLGGTAIPAGTTVLVTGVDGAHLIVLPLEDAELSQPLSGQEVERGG